MYIDLCNPTVEDLMKELSKRNPKEKIMFGTDGKKSYSDIYVKGDNGYTLQVYDGSYQNTVYLGLESR